MLQVGRGFLTSRVAYNIVMNLFADGNGSSGEMPDVMHFMYSGLPPVKSTSGQKPLYRRDEIRLLPKVRACHIERFCLWIPRDLEKWQQLLNRLSQGFCRVIFIRRTDDPEHKHERIYVEWQETYVDADGKKS